MPEAKKSRLVDSTTKCNIVVQSSAWNLKKYMKKLKRAFLVLVFHPLCDAIFLAITPSPQRNRPVWGELK